MLYKIWDFNYIILILIKLDDFEIFVVENVYMWLFGFKMYLVIRSNLIWEGDNVKFLVGKFCGKICL